MNTTNSTISEVHHAALGSLARLRELLDLLAALRQLPWPIRSLDDLRQAVALLLRLAALVRLDEAWRRQLEALLLDEGLLRIALAVVHYVLGSGSEETAAGQLRVRVPSATDDAGPGEALSIDEQTLLLWLPLVVQLLRMIGQLREARE